MRYRFVDRERQWFGVDAVCCAVGVSRGGYWSWKHRLPSARALGDALLLADVKRIYGEGRGTYGSPRVHEGLSQEGTSCGKKRVERLMHDNGIKAKHKRKFKPAVTDSTHKMPVAKNLLNRQFEQSKPNQAWVADTTYVWTAEGWLYLAVMLDLFSRRVVGWAMGPHNDSTLVLRALHMAAQRRRPPKGLLHHSDRGSTYASADYQAALRDYGMVCSMSRKGNCWDNAPMESWFHTLKVELVNDRKFATRREAEAAIFEYMEVFYNKQRICMTIGGLAPAVYEAKVA
jgi:transposase InsO family protein